MHRTLVKIVIWGKMLRVRCKHIHFWNHYVGMYCAVRTRDFLFSFLLPLLIQYSNQSCYSDFKLLVLSRIFLIVPRYSASFFTFLWLIENVLYFICCLIRRGEILFANFLYSVFTVCNFSSPLLMEAYRRKSFLTTDNWFLKVYRWNETEKILLRCYTRHTYSLLCIDLPTFVIPQICLFSTFHRCLRQASVHIRHVVLIHHSLSLNLFRRYAAFISIPYLIRNKL
jgi:hypothetical protein